MEGTRKPGAGTWPTPLDKHQENRQVNAPNCFLVTASYSRLPLLRTKMLDLMNDPRIKSYSRPKTITEYNTT